MFMLKNLTLIERKIIPRQPMTEMMRSFIDMRIEESKNNEVHINKET